MPDLDVSDILSDSDFAQDFQVIRSLRTTDQNGLTVDTLAYFQTYGVITPTSGAQLMLMPEAERANSYITVITPFRFVALTTTTGPDMVTWHGQNYRVRSVNDWSDWGQGFTMAVCQLVIPTQDGP